MSATITQDRIESVLGQEVNIYTITIDMPFNDFLKTQDHLDKFYQAIRLLFDKIKANHVQVPLNIFPAMPIAAVIELDRI